MLDWINNTGRIYWHDQYANNEQETAFSKYDPDRIVDELCETGADVIAVYATNQWGIAYYPSDIWPQHPGLKGRDYFGEVSSRLKARGKKVIAYTNWLNSKRAEYNMIPLGQENNSRYKEQPLASWAEPSDPDKRVQDIPGGQWRTPCFNSPYKEQFVSIAREIADRYQPDLYHLDMLINSGVCVCEYCRPTLEGILRTKDITMKAVMDHWTEFVDWRCESSNAILRDITKVLHERGVGAAHNAFDPICCSAHWGLNEGWVDSIDVYLSECFDAFLVNGADLTQTSIITKLHHALGKPSWMLRTSHQPHYAHWSITQAQWLVASAASKANGCKVFGPCGVGARPDTTNSKLLMRNVKYGFDSFMQDADLRNDSVSKAKIGLVFSWATRRYDMPKSASMPEPFPWAFDFNGWARLLIEEHLPFDLIVAENTVPAVLCHSERSEESVPAVLCHSERSEESVDLSKYDLVILPGATCLSDAFCSTIRDYVSGGGRIIATGDTSLSDEKGSPRKEFALADVLGVQLRGAVMGHFAMERPEEPEPASGDFQQVDARGRVAIKRIEVDPAGSVGACQDPLPVGDPTWPVFTMNELGKGRAGYVAFDIGRLFAEHGDLHIGVLMTEIMNGLLPSRQIEVKAPRSVEVTLWEQKSPRRTIIHVANRTVQWSLPTNVRQISEIIPVHDIEISIPRPYENTTVSARHTDATVTESDGNLVIKLSKVEDYAAVVLASSELA